MMTVQELMVQLSVFDPNMKVVCNYWEDLNNLQPILKISEIKHDPISEYSDEAPSGEYVVISYVPFWAASR